jgi:VWFA-related protein
MPSRFLRLLLVVAVAVAVFPQEPTFRAGVSLVRVDAQVTAAGAIVEGLGANDFVVEDNGQPQPILYCSQEEQHLDLLLLLDTSGSMQLSVRRLAAASRAALAELRTGDRVAVANFNTDSFLIAGLNDNLREVQKTLGRVIDIRFGGGTHILSALYDAGTYFLKQEDKQRRRAVLILTDNFGQSSKREKTVVNQLWAADVVICGLIVRPRGQSLDFSWPGGEDMLGVAAKTGGETVNANDPADAFREMLRRIRRRYSLYYAMPSGKPGSVRRVTLDLAGSVKARYPKAEVLARKGYIIPKNQN